jgi:hypothetical protein
MTPEGLRLECLKLVQQTADASGPLLAPGEIISRARAYANFVIDRCGQGSIAKANGALNLALEEGLRIPAPTASQFELGALAEQARPIA